MKAEIGGRVLVYGLASISPSLCLFVSLSPSLSSSLGLFHFLALLLRLQSLFLVRRAILSFQWLAVSRFVLLPRLLMSSQLSVLLLLLL